MGNKTKRVRRARSKYYQKVQARGKNGQSQKPPAEQPALQVTRDKDGYVDCRKCWRRFYAAPGRVPCPQCFSALEVAQHPSEKSEEKRESFRFGSYYDRW